MRALSAWLPVVLWAAIILSAANDQFSDKKTESWLDRLFGRVRPEVNTIMRKSAHVAEYAILSLLAWRARRTLAVPLLVSLAVACADESLQAMTATRTGTAADVALDMFGATCALLFVPEVRTRFRKVHPER